MIETQDAPTPPPAVERRLWPWVVAAIVVGAIAAYFVLGALNPYVFHGAILQSDGPAPAVDLMATDGQPLDLAAFDGKVVALYFGYTFCPDVCPTTLSDVAKAKRLLDTDEVQVIMVTVDPARDTPELLDRYVTSFDPSFLGAYGSEAQIAEAAALYGVYYEAQEGTKATGYLVDHTATLMVIDPEGHLKLLLPFGVSAEGMAADFEYLLD